MKFSHLFRTPVFHITPSGNVDSILENGLVRGSFRSTSGVETQKKIYVTTSLENIPNPFPNHEFWFMKSFNVLSVSGKGLDHIEPDPEYHKEGEDPVFFMIDNDIEVKHIVDLGSFKFEQVDAEKDLWTGRLIRGEYNGNKD